MSPFRFYTALAVTGLVIVSLALLIVVISINWL